MALVESKMILSGVSGGRCEQAAGCRLPSAFDPLSLSLKPLCLLWLHGRRSHGSVLSPDMELGGGVVVGITPFCAFFFGDFTEANVSVRA